MKKRNLLLIFLLVAVSSCFKQKEQKGVTEAEKFINELTAQDTLDILKLSNAYMDALKADSIDAALSMLHVLEGNALQNISADKEKQLRKNCKYFPVIDYKIDHYSFIDPMNNDVKYTVEFFEHTDPNDNTPNTIGIMLNPVKLEGKWYLTLKEPDDKVK